MEIELSLVVNIYFFGWVWKCHVLDFDFFAFDEISFLCESLNDPDSTNIFP